MNCERCDRISDELWEHEFTNEFGEKVKMKLCWDCDFDVANGGDPFADAAEICMDRAEEDYECDPVYYSKPNTLK